MGLDNPDLINRTVVRRRAASSTGKRRWGTTTTGCSPPPFRNVRVTNAFKNKMDGSRVAGTLSLHLHFRTVSVATISRITIERDGGRDRGGGGRRGGERLCGRAPNRFFIAVPSRKSEIGTARSGRLADLSPPPRPIYGLRKTADRSGGDLYSPRCKVAIAFFFF
jgi:hypothetical protein